MEGIMPMSPARRPRADALRNREKILAEADAVFAEQGVEASLELVARRAGVAIGTLYGHFPTRRSLVGALVRERNEEIFGLGDELLAGPPEEGPARWIRAVAEHSARYGGLAAMLAGGLDDEASELHDSCVRMAGYGDGLIARAREAGVLRSDVTGEDVLALTSAAAWTREQSGPDRSDRLIRFTLAGFRPDAQE
ncbi:helix-turn-helix domain-containing protein [Actinocorallia longicatena]|uniref:TetR/AcrR family transcriptional regulator n=1 Tax=Actinocorallia longicatena TaxID=111803 RepID=A0ABP6Q8Z4_9ACTN